MSEKNGLPSLLERHWAESALAIGAVILAAVSLWVAVDTGRTNRELVASASWPLHQGIVLRAGESVAILSLTRGADNPALWDALASRFTGNLSVRYCYCSALNDCWINTARVGWPRDLNPRQVRSCPRPPVAYDDTGDRGGSFTPAGRTR